MFTGKIEADETYVSGKEKNMHTDKKLNSSRRGIGKAMVVCVKERGSNYETAKVMGNTKKTSLHDFIRGNVAEGSHVFIDDMNSYLGMHEYNHENVCHSTGEHVKEQAHIEARHKISRYHLIRYVQEFAGRLNLRLKDTEQQIAHIASSMIGDQLRLKDLIA